MHNKLLRQEIVGLQQGTVADQILDAVGRAPDCTLDDLDFSSPEYTWNQILLEIDRLIQRRRLEMTSLGKGGYTMRLPHNGQTTI